MTLAPRAIRRPPTPRRLSKLFSRIPPPTHLRPPRPRNQRTRRRSTTARPQTTTPPYHPPPHRTLRFSQRRSPPTPRPSTSHSNSHRLPSLRNPRRPHRHRRNRIRLLRHRARSLSRHLNKRRPRPSPLLRRQLSAAPRHRLSIATAHPLPPKQRQPPQPLLRRRRRMRSPRPEPPRRLPFPPSAPHRARPRHRCLRRRSVQPRRLRSHRRERALPLVSTHLDPTRPAARLRKPRHHPPPQRPRQPSPSVVVPFRTAPSTAIQLSARHRHQASRPARKTWAILSRAKRAHFAKAFAASRRRTAGPSLSTPTAAHSCNAPRRIRSAGSTWVETSGLPSRPSVRIFLTRTRCRPANSVRRSRASRQSSTRPSTTAVDCSAAINSWSMSRSPRILPPPT
ncbi:hypothetical protein FNL39_102348 [Nocardia caishijiensis]|uniref:Uncharacterized protein n=1 Tax=Nocardia caishijiensis TaxID=184756 RepID=A0ABQ6YR16_9NOCA|nr:hypothetical protein FNL39_102348 [Nocardia caishijiensis]